MSVRLAVLFATAAATVVSLPAAADYDEESGYGTETTVTYELDVPHDGYPRNDQPAPVDLSEAGEAAQAPNYVVIEIEDGVPEEIEGETVIVVQEPEPAAATEQAPPPPRSVVVEQSAPSCPDGIWVDGYWGYADGQYVWVDGHCVVERVNYVFVHPRWDFYSNVWWFVPGYYRPCNVWVGFGYYRPWHWFPPYHHSYYRHYRGVPVHRGAPRRPTVAYPAHRPNRGVVSTGRMRTVGRTTPGPYGRTPTVGRAGTTSSRTRVVSRVPTRTAAVDRVPSTGRAPTVSRVPSNGRAPTVSRVPSTGRAPTVNRVSSTTRTPSVVRSAPIRTRVNTPVARKPSVARAPSVVRSTPTRTRVDTPVASTPSVRRPSSHGRLAGAARPRSSGATQTSPTRRPSFSPSRGFGRSSLSPPRPSFGRPSGFSRPTSGGFGRARSVPTARR